MKTIKTEEGETLEDPMDIKIEQEGRDMEYTIYLKEWKARQNTYTENKFKVYTFFLVLQQDNAKPNRRSY